MKRVSQIAFVLHNTHNRALQFGRDTGALDNLPKSYRGKPVDPDHIFPTLDEIAVSFPGTHDPDSRAHLRAKAPRPCTVMACTLSIQTNDKV